MNPYDRTARMIGGENMAKLKNATVAVFGLGGVGGYTVEALARCGVGHLVLVDHDTVSLSNLNRQILATHSTLGLSKVEAATRRVRDIDPEIRVSGYPVFFSGETAAQFDFSSYSYVIDAIDTVTGKLAILTAAKAAGVPVISCMGTGNKLDPGKFRIADIEKTSVCPLARVMRKECAKRGLKHIQVLYSTEDPVSAGKAESGETPPPGRRDIPGSISFVPSVAGLMIAGQVIRDLTGLTQGKMPC